MREERPSTALSEQRRTLTEMALWVAAGVVLRAGLHPGSLPPLPFTLPGAP